MATLTAFAACTTDEANPPASNADATVEDNGQPVGFNPPPPENGAQLLGLPFIVQPGRARCAR